MDIYRQSIELDPKNSDIYYDLALALHRQGKYSEEGQALAKAIQLDPKFPQAHNESGVLNLQGGRIAEAEKEFKTAILLDPAICRGSEQLRRFG